jgi:hypothetical protein
MVPELSHLSMSGWLRCCRIVSDTSTSSLGKERGSIWRVNNVNIRCLTLSEQLGENSDRASQLRSLCGLSV